MKNKILLLAGFTAMLFAFKKLNDVLTDVGTTLEEVKQATLKQIASNDFNLPYYTAQIRDACKKLPPGVREATMMSLGKVVRDYVESSRFQSDYLAYIENAPLQESGPGRFQRRGPAIATPEQQTEARKKMIDNMIASMSNPDVLKTYSESLDSHIEMDQAMLDLLKSAPGTKLEKSKEEYEKDLADQKQLKDLYNKDKESFKTKFAEMSVDQLLNAQKQRQAKRTSDQQQEANDQAAEKQKRINQLKDYKAIVRKQLQQFLNISASVDFNAQLKSRGDKMVFVNPAYEAKPASWKLCFRCGKEAVTGARRFAQDWLNSLK